MGFNRIIYIFYYLKELNKDKFKILLDYGAEISNKPHFLLIIESFISILRYNISISEYFIFRFFEKTKNERKCWAGTGFMYEYQLKMNPKVSRHILEDKISFLSHYSRFVRRTYFDIQSIEVDQVLAQKLLFNRTGKIVVKRSRGQIGAEVEIIKCIDFTAESLLDYMRKKGYNLVEEYVEQHPILMELSPSGLNTVRIITQLNDKNVEYLGARLRISVNSVIDNMAAGNLAAPVNIDSGIVNGPGVFSDITKSDMLIHPVTGIKIVGFEIPHWGKVIKLAKDAALLTPENKSVGWDIAITEDGPELIEGNHNWCKLLWQLPVKKGLKYELEKYLNR